MAGNIDHKFYQDPDYESISSPHKIGNVPKEVKVEKICSVINKEFSSEIEKKEKDIDLIDERLLLAKKTLHKLRYAIVQNYYNSKQYQLGEEDVRQEIVNQKDPVARAKVHSLLRDEQKRIHPALKKILGTKTEVNLDELFKIRPTRKRGKVESQAGPSSENLTIPVDDSVESLRTISKDEIKTEPDVNGDDEPTNVKIPRYIEPKDLEKNVLKMDPAIRNKQKNKFRIIIGNTSKYTPPHSDMDRSTHRWLLYIRGPRDKPDVSHFVNSITIKLDNSYAPHNIIKLKSPPFHLSRRGWGEFPVDVQIHFKNEHLNKPINVVHNLKLDRNYTGIQTLGGETVIDVWLYCDESMMEHLETKCENTQPLSSACAPDSVNIKQEPASDEYMEEANHFVKIKTEDFSVNQENISSKILLKSESKECDISEKNIVILHNANNSSHAEENCLPITRDNNERSFANATFILKYSQKHKSLSKTHPNSLLKINEPIREENYNNSARNPVSHPLQPSQHNANLKAVLEDHCYVKDIYMMQIPKEKLIPNNSVFNISSESFRIQSKNSLTEACGSDGMNVVASIINFFNINIQKIDNIRSAVNIMLKRMPLVHNMAETEEFQRIFPYAVKSEEDFFRLNFIKRRNLEWTRAKIIKNFLKSHWSPQNGKIKIWSVKQIILFSHYHGFFPIKSLQMKCYNESTEQELNNSKLLSHSKVKCNHGFENAEQISTLSDISVYKTEASIKIEPNDESVSNCFHQPILIRKMSELDEYQHIESSDDEIDICNEQNESAKHKKDSNSNKFTNKTTVLPITDIDDKLICSYIEKVCAKLGIELRNEDVGSGFSDCVVHKTMLCAMKCLIEDILRRSLAIKMDSLDYENNSNIKTKPSMWQRTECGLPFNIGLKDVYEAINSRQELDLLTNCGLGTQEIDYTGKI